MTRLILCACLLVSVATGPVAAQVYSGSLTGVVTDASSAAIPAAAVSLKDVNKGFVFHARTDDNGRYILRALPPSAYKLSIEVAGFSTYVRENIVLDVNQNATIDAVLQVSATQQAIEVVGASPLLSTQDAVMGQVLTRAFVDDLPLLGRQVMDLAFLAPGVTLPAGWSAGARRTISSPTAAGTPQRTCSWTAPARWCTSPIADPSLGSSTPTWNPCRNSRWCKATTAPDGVQQFHPGKRHHALRQQ